MATMKKSELWNEVLRIAEENNLSEAAINELSKLLEPKRGGGHSNRIIKDIDGTTYKNCRFTDRLWPESELIYQNDEMREQKKDKGYSKVGISLWNKGQKHIKNIKEEMTNIILADEPDMDKLAALKDELKSIEKNNFGNDATWLEQFATDEQLAELEEISLPIE